LDMQSFIKLRLEKHITGSGLPKDEKFVARHRAYGRSKFGKKTERPSYYI
jgi:hypothetical protein